MLLTVWERLRQVQIGEDKTGGAKTPGTSILTVFYTCVKQKPRGYWVLREAITKVSGSCVLQSLVATGPKPAFRC
jgi:hypothetical protein